ncbi:MAG: HPr family phosphocarrier protein [Planctomycetaceae bacterium]
MTGAGDTTGVEITVVVKNKHGLHARPASVLAETALRYKETELSIRKGDLVVDAKSIMELLLLEATCGTRLQLVAEGPQAPEAVRALQALFEREFDLTL